MNTKQIRSYALSMPEATEEPHFDSASFRIRGKIFITIPQDEMHAHLFVNELDREQALAMYPEFIEKLVWGQKVIGVRITLSKAKSVVVKDLIHQAWKHKAPKRLVATNTKL